MTIWRVDEPNVGSLGQLRGQLVLQAGRIQAVGVDGEDRGSRPDSRQGLRHSFVAAADVVVIRGAAEHKVTVQTVWSSCGDPASAWSVHRLPLTPNVRGFALEEYGAVPPRATADLYRQLPRPRARPVGAGSATCTRGGATYHGRRRRRPGR